MPLRMRFDYYLGNINIYNKLYTLYSNDHLLILYNGELQDGSGNTPLSPTPPPPPSPTPAPGPDSEWLYGGWDMGGTTIDPTSFGKNVVSQWFGSSNNLLNSKINCISPGFFKNTGTGPYAANALTGNWSHFLQITGPGSYKSWRYNFSGKLFITIGGASTAENYPPDITAFKEIILGDMKPDGIIYDLEGWLGLKPVPPAPGYGANTTKQQILDLCKKYMDACEGSSIKYHIVCPAGHGIGKSSSDGKNSPQIFPSDLAGFTHIAPMAYASDESYGSCGGFMESDSNIYGNCNYGDWTLENVKNVYQQTKNDGWTTKQTFLTYEIPSITGMGMGKNDGTENKKVAEWIKSVKNDYAGLLGWPGRAQDSTPDMFTKINDLFFP